jgi:hypothetical protein
MLEMLLEKGADFEQKDFANRAPIYYAVQKKQLNCFKVLLAKGAVPWGVESEDPEF